MRNMFKSNKDHRIALIFLILSVIFWGYSFISTKIVLTELPPSSLAFFRQIIASVTLIVWLLLTKSFSKVTLKHFGVIVVSGLFGIVLYFLFENNGLRLTSASNASIIVSAVPVFTLITEVLFYKLKVNFRMIASILLSIAGVYLVITVNGKMDFSSGTFLGNILVLGAMISWVFYTMLNKKLDGKYASLLITSYQTISSVFLFIPFIIPEVHKWKGITLYPLLNLIYLGVFCSAFAYFFYIYASKRLGSTISSAFLNLTPVVSVIAGYFVLGEKLYPVQFVGMGLIMLSLYQLTAKSKAEVRIETKSGTNVEIHPT